MSDFCDALGVLIVPTDPRTNNHTVDKKDPMSKMGRLPTLSTINATIVDETSDVAVPITPSRNGPGLVICCWV